MMEFRRKPFLRAKSENSAEILNRQKLPYIWSSQVYMLLKWFECLQVKTSSFSQVRQIQNQTASLCFWPARPPQIAEGVAFLDKLCSFEFGIICSQSGFCETSGIGTLAWHFFRGLILSPGHL